MSKFIKKPIVIDAYQWTITNISHGYAYPEWLVEALKNKKYIPRG